MMLDRYEASAILGAISYFAGATLLAVAIGAAAAMWNEARANEGFEAYAAVIGGRPVGCPRRFCGCAMSIRHFGRIIPELKLALNWARKFPRTSARPGAVAVRPGHVFELVRHVNGHKWTVWDPNSGGGKTRIHERSVAGYVFVDPRQKYAGMQ